MANQHGLRGKLRLVRDGRPSGRVHAGREKVRKVLETYPGAVFGQGDLHVVKDLIEASSVTPVIDRT